MLLFDEVEGDPDNEDLCRAGVRAGRDAAAVCARYPAAGRSTRLRGPGGRADRDRHGAGAVRGDRIGAGRVRLVPAQAPAEAAEPAGGRLRAGAPRRVSLVALVAGLVAFVALLKLLRAAEVGGRAVRTARAALATVSAADLADD